MIPKFSYIGAAITTMIAELIMFMVSYASAKDHIDLSTMKSGILKYVVSCLGIVFVWYTVTTFIHVEGIVKIFVVGISGLLVYVLMNMKLWNVSITDIKKGIEGK